MDSLAFGGRGVARLDDFVLFVDRALPGDRVRARVTKVKRSYGEATTVETLAPGPDRRDRALPALRCVRRLQVAGPRLRRAATVWKAQQIARRAERIGHQSDFVQDPIVPRDPHLRLPQQARVLLRRDRGGARARVPPGRPLGRDHARQRLPADRRGRSTRRAASSRPGPAASTRDIWDRRSNTGYLRHLVVRAPTAPASSC